MLEEMGLLKGIEAEEKRRGKEARGWSPQLEEEERLQEAREEERRASWDSTGPSSTREASSPEGRQVQTPIMGSLRLLLPLTRRLSATTTPPRLA